MNICFLRLIQRDLPCDILRVCFNDRLHNIANRFYGISTKTSIEKDVVPFLEGPFFACSSMCHHNHVYHQLHILELLIITLRITIFNHGFYNYHLPFVLRNGFSAFFQDLDALFISPIMQDLLQLRKRKPINSISR